MMHGVKRLTAEKRASKRKESEERAASYRKRSVAALQRRVEKRYDSESLDATAKVVTENPDFTTMWNFRREILIHLHPDPSKDDGEVGASVSATRRAACTAEFALTQECLGYNPKSYPVWHHREWVLTWGQCDWQWPIELKLTAKLLALDDRNFHCWTYRRSVVRIAGVAAEAELKFTSGKIEANFSNYSAWHYRSKLLPAIHSTQDGSAGTSLSSVLLAELELVRNAFFTAPEDSSAWFYHRWLLAQLAPGAAASTPGVEYAAILRSEAQMVEELLELEPDCKWPLAASAFIARELSSVAAGDEGSALAAERWSALEAVDKLRARYYVDCRQGGDAAVSAGRWRRQPGGYFAPWEPTPPHAEVASTPWPSDLSEALPLSLPVGLTSRNSPQVGAELH